MVSESLRKYKIRDPSLSYLILISLKICFKHPLSVSCVDLTYIWISLYSDLLFHLCQVSSVRTFLVNALVQTSRYHSLPAVSPSLLKNCHNQTPLCHHFILSYHGTATDNVVHWTQCVWPIKRSHTLCPEWSTQHSGTAEPRNSGRGGRRWAGNLAGGRSCDGSDCRCRRGGGGGCKAGPAQVSAGFTQKEISTEPTINDGR